MSEVQSKKYTFHGIECEVFTDENLLQNMPSYPWRFRLWKPDGTKVEFIGVLNYCSSRQSAMMRAKARCLWLADGSYSRRYG